MNEKVFKEWLEQEKAAKARQNSFFASIFGNSPVRTVASSPPPVVLKKKESGDLLIRDGVYYFTHFQVGAGRIGYNTTVFAVKIVIDKGLAKGYYCYYGNTEKLLGHRIETLLPDSVLIDESDVKSVVLQYSTISDVPDVLFKTIKGNIKDNYSFKVFLAVMKKQGIKE